MDLDGGIALNEWISGMVVGFHLVVGSGTGWQWWLVEVNFWHGIDCLDVWNLLGWLDLVEAFHFIWHFRLAVGSWDGSRLVGLAGTGLWRGSFTWIGLFIWVNGMDLMFKGRSERNK